MWFSLMYELWSVDNVWVKDEGKLSINIHRVIVKEESSLQWGKLVKNPMIEKYTSNTSQY